MPAVAGVSGFVTRPSDAAAATEYRSPALAFVVVVESQQLADAWQRVLYDCGCRDVFYCPSGDDVECPRHSGFDVCCGRPDRHLPVPAALRERDPRPQVPVEGLADDQ